MAASTGGPGEKLQDFHAELEQLLRKQLDAKPTLDDVRLKLLELYFEQHRSDEFLRAARDFRRLLKQPAESREWHRVISMGRMLHPGEALFSGAEVDRIEFIGQADLAAPKAAGRVRRFGDDEAYRAFFDTLAQRYDGLRNDPKFLAEFEMALMGLATRRPTPLFHAKRLSEHLGGAQLFIKREDLAGENPQLIAAVVGQACVAVRLGCKTLVTGTADGRRGAVMAAVATRLGLKAIVFMEREQAERAASHSLFMRLTGADLRFVKTRHLRNHDVREAALEHCVREAECFLVTGLDAAPPPYPVMTTEFTSTVGRECRRQVAAGGRPAPSLVATRGAQSADAIGLFPAFLGAAETRLACVDAAAGEDATDKNAASLSASERKVAKNILDRLEYPSVAREHALLKASGRVEYVTTPRADARQALIELARLEGIVAPIETAHVLAYALQAARELKPPQSVVVLMAEQAGKDMWDIDRLVNPGSSRGSDKAA